VGTISLEIAHDLDRYAAEAGSNSESWVDKAVLSLVLHPENLRTPLREMHSGDVLGSSRPRRTLAIPIEGCAIYQGVGRDRVRR